jgi:hypothetical protein
MDDVPDLGISVDPQTERKIVELRAAWEGYRAARSEILKASQRVHSIKARLSAERRATEDRVTVDMVTSHYQAHPIYRGAVELRNLADDELAKAVARLEIAWIVCGLPGQRLFGWSES